MPSFVPSQIADIDKLNRFLRLQGWAVVAQYNNPGKGGYTTSGSNYTTFRVKHKILYDCSELMFVYANWKGSGSAAGETANTNAITVKSAVQRPGTSATDETQPRIPIPFAGARTVTIPATVQTSVFAWSDSVPLPCNANSYVFTRNGAQCGTGENIPAGGYRWAANSTGEGVTNNNDSVDSGSMGSFTNGSAFAPVLILGRLNNYADLLPTVAIIGDSIASGTGETVSVSSATEFTMGNSGFYQGFAERSCRDLSIPIFSLSTGGETAQNFTGTTSALRTQLLRYATHAVLNHGTNDLASRTTAQLQADILTITRYCLSLGVRVARVTILPKTTSTDSWATAANQTVTSQESNRLAINAWLRDSSASGYVQQALATVTAAQLAACGGSSKAVTVYDVCTNIEANSSNVLTQNGGRWLATGSANAPTTDGTHPSSAYHQLMANQIPSSWFTF
jgi:lysophospholipase L1-like esterase